MLIEKRDHPIIEQVGSYQRGLAIVKFSEGQLGVGVKEGLLIDAPDAFERADIQCILRAAIARTFTVEFAVSFLVSFGFFLCPDLALT